jgi:hypothetical protein
VYADVKRVCDTQLGVHSQVLVASNVGLGRGGGAGGQMVGAIGGGRLAWFRVIRGHLPSQMQITGAINCCRCLPHH